MKNKSFIRRLGFACKGILSAYKTESSFRTQIVFATAAALLLLILHPRPIWWAVLSLTVFAVLSAELINTALETMVDKLHPDSDPLIGKAKDCAAGAVLLLSLSSLLVAAALICETFL